MTDYISTYTGIHMVPTDPKIDDFRIEDMAHALSLICRGNGQVKSFWSVGEHCIACAKEAAARGLPDRIVLACLLHDAAECYLSDVPRPFKKKLPAYQEALRRRAKAARSASVLPRVWLYRGLSLVWLFCQNLRIPQGSDADDDSEHGQKAQGHAYICRADGLGSRFESRAW